MEYNRALKESRGHHTFPLHCEAHPRKSCPIENAHTAPSLWQAEHSAWIEWQ